MTQTTNIGLKKPAGTDAVNISDLNENADKIDAAIGKTFIATLLAGETTVAFTDDAISTSSTVDPYTDKYGVNPEEMTIEGHTLTMTFSTQPENLGVKVVIK